MLALAPAVLLKLQPGIAFGHAYVRAVITLAAVLTLKPNLLPFAFFCHKMTLSALSAEGGIITVSQVRFITL
jgi:hypothetical protein